MASLDWLVTGTDGTTPTDDFLGTTDNQPLSIRANGLEAVRIATNGNVGIGTGSPGSKLAVNVGASPNPIGALTVEVASFETPDNAQASYFLSVQQPPREFILPNGTHTFLPGRTHFL